MNKPERKMSVIEANGEYSQDNRKYNKARKEWEKYHAWDTAENYIKKSELPNEEEIKNIMVASQSNPTFGAIAEKLAKRIGLTTSKGEK